VKDNWEVTVSLGNELPGGILLRLLTGIKETGSLSRAAREAGISYRYAWSLLNKLEDTLSQQLLVRKAGGYAGGGTELTGPGLRLLSYLLALRQETRLQLASLLYGPGRENKDRHLVVASTMEPVVTGLMDVLEQAYLQETGTVVHHVAAGSGQALELAKAGRADLCLTHAPELEEKFVADGWGTRCLPVMFNDYVLVSPAGDPADVCGTTEVVNGLQKIAASGANFVSRSDLSGTNLLELALWRKAGIEPAGKQWYRESRSVLGSYAALQEAAKLRGYTLVDRASFLAGNAPGLMICLEGDQVLVNVFSAIPVSAPSADQEGAEQLADWLAGPTAQNIIAGFGRHNFSCPLFKPVNLPV